MSKSFDELRDIIVAIAAQVGFDFRIGFTVRGSEGKYIILQSNGWSIHLSKDGTWFLEDTSGG